MNETNGKMIILSLGLLLMLTGVLGGALQPAGKTPRQVPSGTGKALLQVNDSTGSSAPTANKLQASASLQSQGAAVQSSNAGTNLQPNAGASNLPQDY